MVSRLRIVVFTFLFIGSISISCAAVAEGREYTEPTGSPSGEGDYRVEQNPDETYTEYLGNKGGEWVKGETFSSAEVEDARRVALQTSREMVYNPEIQPGDGFEGTYDLADHEAAKNLLKGVQNGKAYLQEDAATAEVQESLVELARGNGLLDTLGTAARGLGTIGLVAGTFALGVEIGHLFGGDDLDELFGIASEAFSGIAPETHNEPGFLFRVHGGETEITRECADTGPSYYPEGGDGGKFPSTGPNNVCMEVNTKEYFQVAQCEGKEHEGVFRFMCPEIVKPEAWESAEGHTFGNCSEYNWEEILSAPFIVWNVHTSGECHDYQFFTTLYEAAMPQPGLFPEHGLGPGIATPTEVEKPHTLPTEKEAEEKEGERELPIPPPLKKETLHEQVPLEGEELPKRTEIEVPEPEPSEVGTQYVTRLHNAGFTNVELETLPNSAIDTSKGPYEISEVYPSPKTKQYPDTKITPEQNPGDAPAPEGGLPLGAPSEPGFKLPDFGVLCKGFPFGVPCWLAETLVAMSTTAKAPDWTVVPEIEFKGHKTSEGKFDFAKLEPIMEIVRPVMVAFSVIGIVLLFYNFAKGGGPPGGSGGNDTEVGSEDEGF